MSTHNDWLAAEEARVARDKAETAALIFPYSSVSEFFAANGDFPENLEEDDENH